MMSLPLSSILLIILLPSNGAKANEELFKMAMIPKFEGNMVFEQAFSGAHTAYADLGSPGVLEYLPPKIAGDNGAAQIDVAQRATQMGFDSILISNNAGESIAEATIAATEADIDVIAWDSPIPQGADVGEQLFVSPVDFDATGRVMADMTVQILPAGGKFAILSASAVSANQNAWIKAMQSTMEANPDQYGKLELVEIVYGDDAEEIVIEKTNYLMDTYPDLALIMSPTTIGIAGAAKTVSERGMCSSLKVSGLGLPAEMVDYTLSGCAPVFALWSFVDLGYLTYYAAYRLAKGEFTVEPGARFNAGRLGDYTIKQDPTRPDIEAYRVMLGDFTLYNKNNVEDGVFFEAIQGDAGQDSFEQRFIDKYKKKAIAIIPKVTGSISFLFSGYIIWNILSDRRKRRLTKNRLLVGISIHDMISSFFGFFLSTWPIPADTWLVYGNVGTTQTCTMQGFFFQAGIGAAPLYSAALTTFYLLNVVFELTTDTIVRRAEPFLHAVPILFGWGTAIAGLPLTLYNAADRVGFMCWISEYPAYCSLRDSCERGENANIYRWAFLYAWVFAVFFYMAACMMSIYHKVLHAEKKTDRWTRASGQLRRRNLSKKVASQGLQYVVAFIFPWLFGITVSIMLNRAYGDIALSARLSDAMTALEIVNAVIWPLKGFFTFLAYVRPEQKTEEASRRSTIQRMSGRRRSLEGSSRSRGTVRRSLQGFRAKSERFTMSTSKFSASGDSDVFGFAEESRQSLTRSEVFKLKLSCESSLTTTDQINSSSLKHDDKTSIAEAVSAPSTAQPSTVTPAASNVTYSTDDSVASHQPPTSGEKDRDGYNPDGNDADDIYNKVALIGPDMALLLEDTMVDTLLMNCNDESRNHEPFGEVPNMEQLGEVPEMAPAAKDRWNVIIEELAEEESDEVSDDYDEDSLAGFQAQVRKQAAVIESLRGSLEEASESHMSDDGSLADLRSRVEQQEALVKSLRESLPETWSEGGACRSDDDGDRDGGNNSLADIQARVKRQEALIHSLREQLAP